MRRFFIKQILPAAAVLLPSLLFLFSLPDTGSRIRKVAYDKFDNNREEEDSSIPLKDRIDLAILQEIELTHDPATGTVPHERLLRAYAYAESLQQASPNGRVAGAIAGVNWTERGPSNVGGRTRTILVDPNDPTHKKVWAAGVGGGLWKTSDITATPPVWNPVNDLFNNIAITTMAFGASAPQTLYFGTGEGYFNADAIRGDGIWKSTDGGSTWAQLASTAGNASFQNVQRIVVHPVSGIVFAATRSGLFSSSNGGTTWTKVLGAGVGAVDDRIADVELAADNSIYAAVGIFTTDGVYKSTTGAAGTFTKMNTGANGFGTSGFSRIELACAPSNASVIYAVTQSSATNGVGQILRSTDGGANWLPRANPVDADAGIGNDFTRTQAWYDLAAAVDPNNSNTIYVGGVDLFKSTDGAATWQQVSHWYGGFGFQDVHADQHAIHFEPGSSSVVYFGNDGGIWRSSNGQAAIPAISAKSDNYNVTQYYACAMNPTAYSSQFLAGAQDNGSQQYSLPGVNATVEVTGGDGCFTHIDQDQQQYQFTSYVYNNYFRSTDTGASFNSMPTNNNGSFVNPTDYDNLNNNLYACNGNGNYYVILNAPASNTFTNVSVAAFNSGKVTHISVSQNTANRVFFGLNNGRVVRVDNAHTTTPTATNITGAGMPAGSVSCIAIENGNDNHLIATYSNYGVNSVWETTNGGTSWISVEGNLPDMPIRWALFSPNSNIQVMLATEVGVWTTDLLNGAATTWGISNNGMANVRTDMLQIRSSDKLVAAATHGRGLYTTDAFADPHPDFAANRRIFYTGKPVSFIDASYKSTAWNWNFGDATTSTLKNPVKIYSAPGLYTVTLQINNNVTLQAVKTAYIQVLPSRGTPYAPSAGGNFDTNPLDFGSESISGTPFERGNSAIAGKSGTNSGANAWVTGLAAAQYTTNSDARLWTPNYNFTATGTYTLKFYRKNSFEIGWDGFIVEYSLNKGDVWTPLGSTVAANWYDFANNGGATSFPNGQAYFNVTKSAYTLCQYDVSFLNGNPNVAFRIRFRSDVTVNAAGMAFDDFEIQGPINAPLPVKLLSFTGKSLGDRNVLEWITATELDNDHFDVERSRDGNGFSVIGRVKGHGTTASVSEYRFNDFDAGTSNWYYRLRQVDYNGASEFSPIIYLRRDDAETGIVTSVFPNPFSGTLNVIFSINPDSEVRAELYDLAGKKVFATTQKPSGMVLSINIGNAGLSAGTYLLNVVTNSGSKVVKVVLQ